MRKYLIRLLFVTLFLCVNLLAFSQKNYPKTLLWRISGKDLEKPSYLFGTMHLKDARIFNFSDSLYHFLEQAEGYAMEIDPEKAVDLMIQSLSEPDTSVLLQDVMEKEEFKKAAKNIEKQFGISADKVTSRQAWLYKMGMGYGDKEKPNDMDAPVDTYLYNIAKRQGKWVGGIEDVEDQFNLQGDVFSVDDFNTNKKRTEAEVEKLIKLYMAQDLNGIEKMIGSYDSSFKDALLTKRNIKMSHRMDSLAHIRSHFFAVGAAHLPGRDGVIQLLEDLGYKVTPVLSTKKVLPANYHYTPIELPWTTIKNDEETFSVLMPGKAVNFKPYGDIMKMKMYVDMGTEIFYFATSMPLPGHQDRDTILKRMAANYARTAKILKQENIIVNNRKGVSLLTVNNGYHCQMKLFIEGNQVVLLMVGSQQKKQLANKDVAKFFESLAVTALNTSNEWYTYEDKKRAFSISFPAKPSSYDQLNQNKGADTWDITNVSFVDPVSQAFYMLLIKETKPGYYIQNDKQLFDEAKTNLENNPDMSLIGYRSGLINNKFSCFWIDGKVKVKEQNKAQQYDLRSYHISRGNKVFSLMVIYDPVSTDTMQAQTFFRSMQLLDYEESNWLPYSDSLHSFTTIAPSAFTTTITDSASGSTQSFAFDDRSGASFYVEKQPFSPYYWVANDSLLYSNAITSLISEEDSLVYERPVTIGKLSGKEYKIRLKEDARNYRQGVLFVNGDTLYSAYTILPAHEAPKNSNLFFTKLQLSNYSATSNLFTSKARILINDLMSPDSVVFQKASDAFDKATFAKQDLPYLHKALLNPLYDFDIYSYCTHDGVVQKVVAFADTSTVAFIGKHYANIQREELKYPILSILARIKTQESYDLFKQLLITRRPLRGNAGSLGYALRDSLLLANSIITELLPLFGDSLFANTLPPVVNDLLDSNRLQLEALQLYHNSIIEACKQLSTRYEQSEGSTAWNIGEWTTLVSRLKTKESIALLKQLSRSSFTYVKYKAVEGLLENDQVIDANVLEKLAADNYYRAYLYTALKEKNKLSLFPVKYANQKSIAQSLLFDYATDDDYEPSSVDFIMTKQATYKGKLATFYLYKVSYSYEEGNTESFLGVIGPIRDKNGIHTEADVINLSSELFDTKLMDKHFKALLAEAQE